MPEPKAKVALRAVDRPTTPLRGVARSAGATRATLDKLGSQASQARKLRGLQSSLASLGAKLDLLRRETYCLGRELARAERSEQEASQGVRAGGAPGTAPCGGTSRRPALSRGWPGGAGWLPAEHPPGTWLQRRQSQPAVRAAPVRRRPAGHGMGAVSSSSALLASMQACFPDSRTLARRRWLDRMPHARLRPWKPTAGNGGGRCTI